MYTASYCDDSCSRSSTSSLWCVFSSISYTEGQCKLSSSSLVAARGWNDSHCSIRFSSWHLQRKQWKWLLIKKICYTTSDELRLTHRKQKKLIIQRYLHRKQLFWRFYYILWFLNTTYWCQFCCDNFTNLMHLVIVLFFSMRIISKRMWHYL